MGGIAGIIDFRGGAPDRPDVLRLSQRLAHRGAAEEISASGAAIFASRAGGVERTASAMAVSDSRLVRGEGAPPDLRDAARLAVALDRGGPSGLAELDGVFAFASWDEGRQTLTLARDAFGVRPLFWARQGTRVAFASEIPALLRLPWLGAVLASENLSEYLSFRYTHAPRTLLQDIFEVPAGHAVSLRRGETRILRWYTPPAPPPEAPLPDERDTSRRVDAALRRAVGRALGADPAVGVLLSGGLDSSAILYHARAQGRPVSAFTVALAGDPADESPFAGRVARVLGAEHHLVRLESREIIEAIGACTNTMGQPLPTAAAVLQSLSYREAAQHLPVLLSGDGGDELLGGRRLDQVAYRLRLARVLGRLPPGLRALGMMGARLAKRSDLTAGQRRFGLSQRIGGSAVFDATARRALLRDPGLVHSGLRSALLGPLYDEIESDPLNEILHVWQRGWLAQDSLARSDRMAANAGLEVRYPLLDREFASLCLSLPGEAKVSPSGLRYRPKWPLRQAMEGRIPPNILHRPKRAAPAPLDQWLRSAGAGFLAEGIAALTADPEGPFHRAEILRLADEHRAGIANHGIKLWTLLLFDVWRSGLR